MEFDKCYKRPLPSIWQGRNDGGLHDRFFKNVICKDFSKEQNIENKSFCLIGFVCDEGIKRNLGRLGAAEGPRAFRTKLTGLAFHGSLNHKIYDLGDVTCMDKDLEGSQYVLSQIVAEVRKRNSIPLVFGGGHELAWGHYLGLVKAIQKPLAVVNIDAHFDLRPLEDGKGTSGTSFNQMAEYCKENKLPFNYLNIGLQEDSNTPYLFDIAKKFGVKFIEAEEIYDNQGDTLRRLKNYIVGFKDIYVSICLDVFAQAFAPGVSAPSPFGLAPYQVAGFLNVLAESKKVIGFDIAELSPKYDIDGTTANLSARLMAHFLKHYEF